MSLCPEDGFEEIENPFGADDDAEDAEADGAAMASDSAPTS